MTATPDRRPHCAKHHADGPVSTPQKFTRRPHDLTQAAFRGDAAEMRRSQRGPFSSGEGAGSIVCAALRPEEKQAYERLDAGALRVFRVLRFLVFKEALTALLHGPIAPETGSRVS